jgi:hypothetical protein
VGRRIRADLFEQHETTFGEFITERRLAAALAMLRSPRLPRNFERADRPGDAAWQAAADSKKSAEEPRRLPDR